LRICAIVTLLALEDNQTINPVQWVKDQLDNAEPPGTVEYECHLAKDIHVDHPDIPVLADVDWADEATAQPYVKQLNKAYGEWALIADREFKKILEGK
jgi:hypothetical protein